MAMNNETPADEGRLPRDLQRRRSESPLSTPAERIKERDTTALATGEFGGILA